MMKKLKHQTNGGTVVVNDSQGKKTDVMQMF